MSHSHESDERCTDCGGTLPWYLTVIDHLVEDAIPDVKDSEGRHIRAIACNALYGVLIAFKKTYDQSKHE